MSKRIARIIRSSVYPMRGSRETPIRASLPKPESDKCGVHQHENEREEEIDALEQRQDADGEETRVIAEKIPATHQWIKNFAITSAVLVPHASLDGPRGECRFDVGMFSDG